jgi:hypothetical protein
MKATALLASTLILMTACGPGGPLRPASNATPLVPAAAVQRGPIQQSINTSAEVRAKAQITVRRCWLSGPRLRMGELLELGTLAQMLHL